MSGYSRDMVETVRLCSYLLGTQKRMIFLSSGGTIYGKQDKQPIKEEVYAQPINHYGNVKLCIENSIRVFNMQMHTKILIARISNPYGPGQDYKKGVGFIDATVKKALNKETLQIWGDGNIIRDYIYIGDVCEMLYQMSLYEGEEEVFNLSSGIGTSQNQIVELVRRINGDLKVEYTSGRSVDVQKIILDNTKIRRIYEKELVSLNEGLQNYFETIRENNGDIG
jgi:UDP-glucose 4-epimerase